MSAEFSTITYFAPIIAFLIVFIVSFTVLFKTKILGENNWIVLFVSFLISILFVSSAGARQYVTSIIPWFAVLLLSLFFIFVFTGFIGKPIEFLNKGIGIAFVIILGLVFLISSFFIFSNVLVSYLPGTGFGTGTNLEATMFLDWLYSPRVAGAILLIIVCAVVSWILVKTR